MRYIWSQRRPKAVDAARIDNMRCIGLHQHRQEGTRTEIDATPADVEGPLPLCAAVAKKASTTANSSIVEEQLKLVGGVISRERLAEAQNLSFIGDVGDVAGNANIPGQPWLDAEIACLGHTRRGKIAHCHVAALGDEPAHQLASHTAAATRNDRKL